MTTIEQRLRALERIETERVRALPPRRWIEDGYVRLDRLPDAERVELEGILYQSFTESGHIDHTRLSREQQKRGAELVGKLMEGTTP